MNCSEFSAFLRKLADAVESGDSAEGCVVYALSDRGPEEVDLDIRVRTGNLNGQGGYFVVDTMPKGAAAQDCPCATDVQPFPADLIRDVVSSALIDKEPRWSVEQYRAICDEIASRVLEAIEEAQGQVASRLPRQESTS